MYSFDGYPLPKGYFKARDGIELPYFQYGRNDAAQTILFLNGFTCNQFNIAKVVAALGTEYRVITFDYRGQGLAYRERYQTVSIDSVLDDIESLYEHIGRPQVLLFGYSMGCQLAVEWNYRDSSRVQAMVLLLGIYGNIFDTFMNLKIFAPMLNITHRYFPVLKSFLQATWRVAHSLPYALRVALGRGALLNPERVAEHELRPFLDQLADLDFEYILHMSHAIHHHTNEGQFERISAPCLIISGEADLFALPLHSERVHQAVPASWYFSIPSGTHNAILEHADDITGWVFEFLREKKLSFEEQTVASSS